jgi:hypothetical protein
LKKRRFSDDFCAGRPVTRDGQRMRLARFSIRIAALHAGFIV